jgi:tetratricopeptide (TPR) repeat protein
MTRVDTPPAADASDAHERLRAGLQYEQAGMWAKAHSAYGSVLAQHTGRALGVEAQIRLARVHRAQAHWAEALLAARAAADQAQALAEPDLWAEAVNVEVGVHLLRGEHAEADRVAAEALAHALSPRIRGLLLHNRGSAAAQRHQFADAAALFAEAVASFREAGYELGIAFALNSTSAAAHDAGRPAEALELAREAFGVAQRILAYDQCVLAVENQADPLVSLGRFAEAETLASEALGHFSAIGDEYRRVECLEILGRVFAARPDASGRVGADHCYRRGLEIAREIGAATLVTRMERRLKEVA